MRSIVLAIALVAAFLVCPPAAASSAWRWPVEGRVITPYRNGVDPYAGGQHRGIDIAAPVGTIVVAATGGTVRFAGVAGDSGLTVAVRTDDGRFDTSYLHLSAILVRAGDRVAAGLELGSVGITGRRSAAPPHLHFGVREAGTRFAYRDPLDFLPPPPATRPMPKGAPLPVAVPAMPRAEPGVGPPALASVPVAGVVAPVALLTPEPHAGAGHAAAMQPVDSPAVAAPGAAGRPQALGAAAPVAARPSPTQLTQRAHRASRSGDPLHRSVTRGGAAGAATPLPAAGPAPAPNETPVVLRARSHPAGAAHVSPPQGRGIDLGWLAACVGMVAAAALLGRPRQVTRSLRQALALTPPAGHSPKPDPS